MFGRDHQLLRELALEAFQAARSADDSGIRVHAIKWEGWSRVATKAPRPANSVVMPEGVFEVLAEDLRTFRAARDWYGEMGIPWKRGYLLYGPPGNGKSSLVLALATLIGAQLYYLNLANAEVSDESLPGLLAEVPGGSIVLIEEVDTLFEQREAKRVDTKLTFGGLLNALDGPTSQEGLVVVMTTNHLERLDPALVRPGRADLRIYLGHATPEQARRLFRRFYPEAPEGLTHQAGERLAAGEVSMASLQEHFLRYRDDPEGAIAHLPRLVQEKQAAADTLRPEHLAPARLEQRAVNHASTEVGRGRLPSIRRVDDHVRLALIGG
jgi:chaperone BCS1